MKTTMEKTFLEFKQAQMEFGFWEQESKSSMLLYLEATYNQEIIKEWGISNILVDGDTVLIKWFKRYTPLTEVELRQKYGYEKAI